MGARARLLAAALVPTLIGAAPAGITAPAGNETPGPATPVGGASVHVDDWGVPHVVADDPLVMAEAFGHAQASERLFEMDVIRRLAQGRLSELLGEGAYDADVLMRREFYDRDALDTQLAQLPPELRDLLAAYADGVNRAMAETLATATDVPAVYAALGDAPRPWTPHDSVSVLNLFTAVSFAAEGEGGELDNVATYRELVDRYGADAGDDVFDDLWEVADDTRAVIADEDAPPAPAGVALPDRPHPSQLDLGEASDPATVAELLRDQLDAAAHAVAGVPVPKVGSYAVAIAGEHTASGGGLLLGAPQAGFTFPSTFHEVGIHVPGWDCQGMTVPGLGPLIGIGWCNGHAWTLVAGNAGDQVDVYVEQLAGDGYRFGDAATPFRERTETFVVKSTLDGTVDVRQETYRYTVHGAVFHEDPDRGVAFTTRRAQAGRSVRNLEGLYLLNTATGGVDEIMAGTDRFTASYQLTLADDDGHIAYTFTGLQPIRAHGYDRRFPMPGTGEAEWAGMLPPDQRPQVIDPANGIIAVNQGVESKPVGWWPPSSWLQVGAVNRVAANYDLLEGEPGGWTADRLETINRDLIERREPFTQVFAREIDQALASGTGDPRLAALRDAWEDWRDAGYPRTDDDGDGRYDQLAAAVFQPDRYYGMPASPVWSRLFQQVFHDEVPARAGGHYFQRLSLLDRVASGDDTLSRSYADDVDTNRRETFVQQLRAAIAASLPALAERYGSDDPADWRVAVTELDYDVLGLAAPRTMRVLDHGTYSFIADPRAGHGRSILPPGNGSADGVVDEATFATSGALPAHADDQIGLYEAWRFKPMRRHDHAAVTSSPAR